MIIVQLLGGLGNQLFQYAAGRCLAIHHGVPLRLDISAFDNDSLRTYRLNYFNVEENFATVGDIWRAQGLGLSPWMLRSVERHLPFLAKGLRRRPVFEEKIGNLNLTTGSNVYLLGYWQNESYFQTIEKIIRHEFSFRMPPSGVNQSIISQIQSVTSVSLHIRRGDYAVNPETRAVHGLLPLEYYHRAVNEMTRMIKDPHFFIFSDDVEWAVSNLKLNYATTVVDQNTADTDYEDLRLLSFCQHHIIANSTFSWWGAWLSAYPQKKIIAPVHWFNRPDLQHYHIAPETWQRLSW